MTKEQTMDEKAILAIAKKIKERRALDRLLDDIGFDHRYTADDIEMISEDLKDLPYLDRNDCIHRAERTFGHK